MRTQKKKMMVVEEREGGRENNEGRLRLLAITLLFFVSNCIFFLGNLRRSVVGGAISQPRRKSVPSQGWREGRGLTTNELFSVLSNC